MVVLRLSGCPMMRALPWGILGALVEVAACLWAMALALAIMEAWNNNHKRNRVHVRGADEAGLVFDARSRLRGGRY